MHMRFYGPMPTLRDGYALSTGADAEDETIWASYATNPRVGSHRVDMDLGQDDSPETPYEARLALNHIPTTMALGGYR